MREEFVLIGRKRVNPEEAAQGEEGDRIGPTDGPSRKPLSIRPYARLLTMLGEQLLKNERVALVELIKNSYDADAEPGGRGVFEGFGQRT